MVGGEGTLWSLRRLAELADAATALALSVQLSIIDIYRFTDHHEAMMLALESKIALDATRELRTEEKDGW